MAAVQFQPPPTWANPILETKNPANGSTQATFNPVWLKWFVDLTSVLTSSGGGGGAAGNVVGPAVSVAGHVALFNNATGTLLSDGGAPVQFADSETPAGLVDGVNTVFNLANAPSPALSLFMFHKTGRLVYIEGTDYTLAGTVVTFTVAPALGDLILCFYRY